MYTNSAYLFQKDKDICETLKPLLVTGCGNYRIRNISQFRTFRPNGRSDFQLLYIVSGNAHFYFDNEETVISAGHMVLFQPSAKQEYVYFGTDKPEVYWIHFTGINVEQMLETHQIPLDEPVFYCGNSMAYENLFKEMITELQNRNPHFEKMTVLYFEQLLLQIQRNRSSHPQVSAHSMIQEVETAKHYFYDNYKNPISIEDYAHSRNISTCWFIRSFRNVTGNTPLQYILSIRIHNAKMLLEHTPYNITEIASLVGFDDPLYFSHLFKKHAGVSPSEYRKRTCLAK